MASLVFSARPTKRSRTGEPRESLEYPAAAALRPRHHRPPHAVQSFVHVRRVHRFPRHLCRRRDHGLNIFGYRIGRSGFGSFSSRSASNKDERLLHRFSRTVAAGLDLRTGEQHRVHGLRHHQEQENDVGRGVLQLGPGQRGQRLQLCPVGDIAGHLVAGLPDNGLELFHLGGSLSSRTPSGNLRFGRDPGAVCPYFVDTGQFDASRSTSTDIEIVGLNGPFSFQSEAIMSEVKGTDYGDLGLRAPMSRSGISSPMTTGPMTRGWVSSAA